jgi:glycosyltransferase involved in cell wall biosynthesis
VVSFNNSGQTDIIKHKENGYLAKWKDSHDLAAGINYVLNQTFDREQLRQYAVTQFSENKVASQYIQLYQSLLNK